MAKKVTQKDLRELIAMCIKKTFPEEKYEGYFPALKELERWIIMDSIYIELKDSGKFTKRDIFRLNKYFRMYSGKNLIVSHYDKDKNVLIIRNEYEVIN